MNIKTVVQKKLGHIYNTLVLPKHYLVAIAANLRYSFPSSKMRVIGVTGTNGKTTTVNMIARILAKDQKVGLISTTTVNLGDGFKDNKTHFTTADSMTLQKMLATMRKNGCETVVLEVSSHSLVQGRVWGIKFDAAVMTNLTPEHLDYHGTMTRYAAAKARLFKRSRSVCVLNGDDDHFETFKAASRAEIRVYGQSQTANTKLIDAHLSPQGSEFKIKLNDTEQKFNINLIGAFNVYNAMAAITVCNFYNIDVNAMQSGLNELKSVPGRMQLIDEGQSFTVVVDFAHTPDAFKNIFAELKKITKKRLIIVIGCDGDRDKTKRAPIGRLAAEYGDHVILTEVENHTEDSENIRKMVREGIKSVSNAKWSEVVDRREAIAEAFRMARKGDLVVLPSMGGQYYRVMNDGEHYWDESEVAREELKRLLKG